MANLYDLAETYRIANQLLNDSEESGDFIEAENHLFEAEGNFADKVENIVKLIKNIESDAQAYKEEAARLTKKRQSADKKVKWLKDYIESAMNLTGAERVEGELFTVAMQNNPVSLEIQDVYKVPEDFLTYHKPSVNKRELLAHIKETGEVFEGVKLEQKKSLRIR